MVRIPVATLILLVDMAKAASCVGISLPGLSSPGIQHTSYPCSSAAFTPSRIRSRGK